MKRPALTILFVLLVLVVYQASATQLLQNGSFQTGDFTDWTLGTTPYGIAGDGFPSIGQWPLNNNINAWEGNVGLTDFCCGEQGATLAQSFTSGSGIATVTFDYAAMGRPGGWNAEGGFFVLLLDGQTLATALIGGIYPGQIINASFNTTVSLDAGEHTFEIEIERYATSDEETPLQFITDTSVDFQTVPEPGSLVLMGSGVLGLAGVMRRKLGF